MTYSLFLMGCWNKIHCNKEKENNPSTVSYRNEVIDSIKENKHWDAGIVAGDNAYPDKNKIKDKTGKKIKTKTFRESVVKTGFELLKQVQTKEGIKVGIGNHDTECPKVFDIMKSFQEDKKLSFHDDVYGYPAVELSFCNVYFVNTNKWDEMEDNDTKNHDDFVRWQTSSLYNFLVNQVDNKPIFIVGHRPLIAWKPKLTDEKTYSIRTNVSPIADTFLDTVLGSGKNNVFYLCADVHNFQQGPIRYSPKDEDPVHVLTQVVCGTGGADADKFVKICDENTCKVGELAASELYSFEPVETRNPHGYCEINISDQYVVTLKYVHVPNGSILTNSDPQCSSSSETTYTVGDVSCESSSTGGSKRAYGFATAFLAALTVAFSVSH